MINKNTASEPSVAQDRAIPARSSQREKNKGGRPRLEESKVKRNYSITVTTDASIKELARNPRAYGEVVDEAVKLLVQKKSKG